MPLLIRLNGRTLAPADASVSVLDHGFLYGFGLFETMRATEGRILALEEHLARLEASARLLALPAPPADHLASEVSAAVAESVEQDAYVRLTVTRGPGAPAPDPSSCGPPTYVVIVKPFSPPPAHWTTEGVHTVTSSLRRNSASPLPRVKSTNYLECLLAKLEARSRGAEEAILLDTEGYLAEATAWNLFFVEGGRLLTPDERGPLLPGVTRAVVLRLAAERGLPTETGAYPPERLPAAEEAFLTNSLYGVVPLGSLDGHRLGRGPVTASLAAAYDALRRAQEPIPKPGVGLRD